MSVSQQKLFNYEYKIAMRDDWEKSSRFKKNIVNHLILIDYSSIFIFVLVLNA
jgi:hypothetical protein